jgi:PKD repeat protein
MRFITFTLLITVLTANVFATQSTKTVKLRLQSPSGNVDVATMYFDQGITPKYDVHEDAQKVFANVPGVPEIYSLTADKIACSINGCGTLSSASTVSIGTIAGYNGLYTFTASLIDNFDATSVIQLEDRQLGVWVDLRQNFYQAQLDTTDSAVGRFYLHVSSAVQYSLTPSSCTNTGGEILLNPDTSITWSTVQLYNSGNHLLATDTNVNAAISFKSLIAGDYTVVFKSNQYTATDSFHLTGNFVVASIQIPSQIIYVNEDVVFNAIVTNGNNYAWDFGDGTIITGVANPDQIYLQPGTYTVSMTSTNNEGCSSSATTTVTVLMPTGINDVNSKDIIVSAIGKTITVNLNDAVNDHAELGIFNLLGQSVYSAPFNSQKQEISLDGQATGYYLVSVKNAGKLSTRRVFIAR